MGILGTRKFEIILDTTWRVIRQFLKTLFDRNLPNNQLTIWRLFFRKSKIRLTLRFFTWCFPSKTYWGTQESQERILRLPILMTKSRPFIIDWIFGQQQQFLIEKKIREKTERLSICASISREEIEEDEIFLPIFVILFCFYFSLAWAASRTKSKGCCFKVCNTRRGFFLLLLRAKFALHHKSTLKASFLSC